MPTQSISGGPRLMIGALSRRTGCKVETIRYYERIGLLPPPPRSAGGQRHYGKDGLKRLTFIRRSRELGFSLKEVRGLLRLVDGGGYTCAEVRAITLDHLAEVRQDRRPAPPRQNTRLDRGREAGGARRVIGAPATAGGTRAPRRRRVPAPGRPPP
jgi:MerR family mercuric resistance operon transcriptional regulator